MTVRLPLGQDSLPLLMKQYMNQYIYTSKRKMNNILEESEPCSKMMTLGTQVALPKKRLKTALSKSLNVQNLPTSQILSCTVKKIIVEIPSSQCAGPINRNV